MDISGESAPIHMRTDANNLVTTASTTHLPEQKETIHMIQMLRKEACSGALDDLAHVRTEFCLADCLTKSTAKPDNLIKAVETGMLPLIDTHPLFRSTLQHRAYFAGDEHDPVRDLSLSCDYWKIDDMYAERVHVQPRRTLFVPKNVPGVLDVDKLMEERHSLMCTVFNEARSVRDRWEDTTAHAPMPLWTGCTRFALRS